MAGWNFISNINKKKKRTEKKKRFQLVILAKLAEVSLNICEHAGKVKSYPGRWLFSGKGTVER